MDFAVFGLVSVLALAIPVYGLMPVRPRQKYKNGNCQNCGYSREGLGEAQCPECGSAGLPCKPTKELLPSRIQQALQWLALCVCAALAMSLRYTLIRACYGLLYMKDGFTFEQGWRLSPIRELFDETGYGTTAFGVMMLALPVFAREASTRVCARQTANWLAVAFAISLVFEG